MRRLVLAVAALALGSTLASAQAVQVDPSVAPYQKTSGVSGNINSVGSDTMNNMMALWAETFRKMYPNVKIQIEGKGSSTAPPALIAGTSQFGPMSRPMKASEIDQFEAKYGYKPTQIRTSYDALAVYVNKDNPLEQLTLAAGGRGLLEDAPARRQGRQDVGRPRPHRRLGGTADLASTAATRRRARTASSRSTCSRTATTATRSRSSRARRRSSRASPRTASASATAASATRPPASRP